MAADDIAVFNAFPPFSAHVNAICASASTEAKREYRIIDKNKGIIFLMEYIYLTN